MTDLLSLLEDRLLEFSGAVEPHLRPYFLVSGSDGPRWLLPDAPHIGLGALQGWTPSRWSSRAKWQAFLFAYRQNLLRALPQVRSVQIRVPAFWNIGTQSCHAVPVFYVGSANEQQKVVCQLVDPDTCSTVSVLKIPIAADSRVSIFREADILLKLQKSVDSGVPRLLARDDQSGITAQTALHGKPSSFDLKSYHIRLLLKLRRSEEANFPSFVRWALVKALKTDWTSVEEKKVLTEAAERIDLSRSYMSVWGHGDFTPWNIRVRDDACFAFDWEEGMESGLPLHDCIHFIAIQHFLFRQRGNLFANVIADKGVQSYAEAMELGSDQVCDLMRAYCLERVARIPRGHDPTYQKYVVRNLSAWSA